MAPSIIHRCFSAAFEYKTLRIVRLKSKKVGILHRIIQFFIVGYVIGFSIIYKRGYQEFDDVGGTFTTSVKGVATTENLFANASGTRIWDVPEYVQPPKDNNAFFVITNLIITDGQQMGVCLEDNKVAGANCTLDANVCKKNTTIDQPLPTGDGYLTGNCHASDRYNGEKSCEIFAWCPTENRLLKPPSPPALEEAENFTVFIKNHIEFPKYDVQRNNIPDYEEEEDLINCRYDADSNNLCPIFQLKTIIQGTHTTNFKEIATKGGVVQVIVTWDCNLDYDEDYCRPEYTFRRLDKDTRFSKGYSFRLLCIRPFDSIQPNLNGSNTFGTMELCSRQGKFEIMSVNHNARFARHYKDANGKETRTLFKAYGIKFLLRLEGAAGKFSVKPLLLHIGSGIALLAIATFICDILACHLLNRPEVYKKKKFAKVFDKLPQEISIVTMDRHQDRRNEVRIPLEHFSTLNT